LKKETDAQKLPAPKMSLWIKEAAGPPLELTDQALVRRPYQLLLAINNFPPDQVDTVQWQFDTSPPVLFDRAAGRERSVDLTRLGWTPAPHQSRVAGRTRESEPQTFTRTLEIRYVPPPPVVRFDADWLKRYFGDKPVNDALPLRLEVREARFRVQAKVFP